jgi:integrase/recombinase XerD
MNSEILTTSTLGYRETIDLRNELIWDRMEGIYLSEMIIDFLSTLEGRTKIVYRSIFTVLQNEGLINFNISLRSFSNINHNNIVDRIKQVNRWAENTKKAKAACYISFTDYLCRRFDGIIIKAMPCKHGVNKTFVKVYDKVVRSAMTQTQWLSFFDHLKKLHYTHYLMAKLIIQGAKRYNEVAELKVENIDWENRQITYKQSKTGKAIRYTVITYPQSIMDELKVYVGNRKDYVFETTYATPINNHNVNLSFRIAGRRAGIPFIVSAHILRVTAITYLLRQGFNDSEIMKISGHTNSTAIHAYDKSDRCENPTQRISLVT